MFVLLHSVSIALHSQHRQIIEQWKTLFDYELNISPNQLSNPDIWIEAKVTPELPDLTSIAPIYSSHTPSLFVYSSDDDPLSIRLADHAHITIRPRSGSCERLKGTDVTILVTPS